MKCVGPSSVCTTMIDGKGAEHTICTQEIFEKICSKFTLFW